MKNVPVEVKRLTIPVAAVAGLSDEQRHFYYLFGLIYNESICLRKMISFSLNTHNDARYFRSNSELSQTFFLFRVACSKVWEARLKLNSADVRQVLVQDVYPQWQEGPKEQKQLNKISGASWISDIRNGLGFHYPSLGDWKGLITPNAAWADDNIFLGTDPGNLYFDAPEQVIREQMFGPLPSGATGDQQMEKRVQQMVELLVQLNEFVENALGRFIATHLIPTGEATPVGRVAAPRLNEVSIPFWTRELSNPKSKRRS
jgi:hypothetical protein